MNMAETNREQNDPATAQRSGGCAQATMLADLVERWRKAETHWRKRASDIDRDYEGKPIYEDGLAEAFGRCADILANTIAKSANTVTQRPGTAEATTATAANMPGSLK
jgi:hypothetical protein